VIDPVAVTGTGCGELAAGAVAATLTVGDPIAEINNPAASAARQRNVFIEEAEETRRGGTRGVGTASD
jgi:hypothetical protein